MYYILLSFLVVKSPESTVCVIIQYDKIIYSARTAI